MKNICIVSECQQILGIGGTETVSFILKEELIKHGYNVWSFYLCPKADKTTYDVPFPQTDDICSDENKQTLTNVIAEHQIEAILLQGAPIQSLLELCIEAKKATGVKLIYTYHFSPLMYTKDYDDFKERSLYKLNPIIKPLYNLYFELKRPFFIRKSLKHFQEYDIESIDAFVSVNKEDTVFFQNFYPHKFKNRFHTIANPIIIETEELPDKKENIILFVGRLTFQKRVDRLLYVWKELQNEFSNWKVVIVGNGNYADEYKNIAKDLQLKNVEFVGQQPAENYFRKSKVLCMTSSHESFGMVLVEAQKYGCAPIAYNSFDTVRDIIQHEHNGFLITPYLEKEFVNGLRTLITDEEMRDKFIKNGKEFIKKFDSKIIVKKWINLFETL